ncbi:MULTISPECIES: DUF4175 domain-containing protein [unclassified Pseudomonas]|uniref:DUF4175 domain-containing protein n=1 Tax=unclassified Pseudomonas TaxID=196821 RepID=UPI001E47B3C8|nr:MULTISPECIES: DUF4175 domain-containing protein [unclassified Pseudomonas]MDC0686108.1 DUF4175 domain-containing protein [Mitsuaria sp. RG]MCE0913901.1 DUF4175 domain-containing protein [Pseudomonas sp. NMI760_13]MCF1490272.1 DUF4175 domain-containing protein [Pseudomonas sp. AA27]MCP8636492.1 DUF4175 domain-containing protein [Pseudomonas sp. DVZ6]MDD7784069.1 DUF4175 domain-containing protein [Pseudomonas sp. DVZ24]
MSHKSQSTRRIFAWPALIAVLSAAGLFAALLGDGMWDMLAWVGLGVSAGLGLSGFWRR